LGIAGKVNPSNIVDYIGRADYCCVFSYLRHDSDYSKPISEERVRKLMRVVRSTG
jgi:predicted TIM-barrel enzyme